MTSPTRWVPLSTFAKAAQNDNSIWNLDACLKTLQMLAIVAGALWALNEYISFKRENNELQNQAQRLAVEQSKLTVQMTNLNIQAASLARVQQESLNKISELNLQKSTDGRLDISDDIKAHKVKDYGDGTSLYYIDCTYIVKNISDRRLEISKTMMALFIGSVSLDKLPPDGAIEIIGPMRVDTRAPGNVGWKELSRVIAYYRDTKYRSLLQASKPTREAAIKLNGQLTGELGSGEQSIFVRNFYLRARPDQFFATIFEYTLDGGGPSADRMEALSTWESLSDPKSKPSMPIRGSTP